MIAATLVIAAIIIHQLAARIKVSRKAYSENTAAAVPNVKATPFPAWLKMTLRETCKTLLSRGLKLALAIYVPVVISMISVFFVLHHNGLASASEGREHFRSIININTLIHSVFDQISVTLFSQIFISPSIMRLICAALCFYIFIKLQKYNNDDLHKVSKWTPLFLSTVLILYSIISTHVNHIIMASSATQYNFKIPVFYNASLVTTRVLIYAFALSLSIQTAHILSKSIPVDIGAIVQKTTRRYLHLLLFVLIIEFFNYEMIALTDYEMKNVYSQNIIPYEYLNIIIKMEPAIVNILFLLGPFFIVINEQNFVSALLSCLKSFVKKPFFYVFAFLMYKAFYLLPFLLNKIDIYIPSLMPLYIRYWFTPFVSIIWQLFTVLYFYSFFEEYASEKVQVRNIESKIPAPLEQAAE